MEYWCVHRGLASCKGAKNLALSYEYLGRTISLLPAVRLISLVALSPLVYCAVISDQAIRRGTDTMCRGSMWPKLVQVPLQVKDMSSSCSLAHPPGNLHMFGMTLET